MGGDVIVDNAGAASAVVCCVRLFLGVVVCCCGSVVSCDDGDGAHVVDGLRFRLLCMPFGTPLEDEIVAVLDNRNTSRVLSRDDRRVAAIVMIESTHCLVLALLFVVDTSGLTAAVGHKVIGCVPIKCDCSLKEKKNSKIHSVSWCE